MPVFLETEDSRTARSDQKCLLGHADFIRGNLTAT